MMSPATIRINIFLAAAILGLLQSSSMHLHSQVESGDSLALVSLHNATNGPNWLMTWDLNQPVTNWYGITLTNGNTRVAAIQLGSNNLVGSLPMEIGNLSEMKDLDLSVNGLTDSLPSSLGNLVNLETLRLSSNAFLGTIPDTIGNLTALTLLALDENHFTGAIPSSFGNLVNLDFLILSRNTLDATPPTLGMLTNLRQLSLEFNSFSGSLPGFLGNLVNLERLDLNDNSFNDSLPIWLVNLIKPELYLDLSNNNLFGPFPVEYSGLCDIQFYNFCNNPGLPASGNFEIFCDPELYSITTSNCDSLVSPSGNHTWTESGTYLDTIINMGACDSIFTVHLDIYPSSKVILNLTECHKYVFGDDTLYQSVDTVYNLQSSTGCDSIVELHLTIVNDPMYCNSPPEAICIDSLILYAGDSCMVPLNAPLLDGGSTDPDGDTLTFTSSSGPLMMTGFHEVGLIVSDGLLTDTCMTFVIVLDTMAPLLTGASITLQLDSNGQAETMAGDLVASLTDNCGVNSNSVMASQTQFDTSDLGVNLINLTVVDFNGNQGHGQAMVTVEPYPGLSNHPPVAWCIDTLVLNTESSAMVSLIAEQLDGGSYDPDGDTLVFSHYPAGPFQIGANPVFLVVYDGNLTDTCEAILVLVDTTGYPCQMDGQPPIANCQDLILELDESGMASLTPEAFSEFFTDNCEIDSIWISAGQTTFTCNDLDSMHLVTLMALDPAGNSAVCTVEVAVTSGTYEQLLYWTDGSVIWQHNLSANVNDSIINTSLLIPIQLLYYEPQNALFIGDGRLILMTNLHGMVLDTIFEADTFSFSSFDVDPVHGDLYLLGIHTKAIHKVPLDGSGSSVVRDLDYLASPIPRKIQCDPVSGLLYWTDSNDGKIRRCKTDGSNLEVLVDFMMGEGNAYGLDLDLDNGLMYWTNPVLNKIQQSDLAGNFREDVVSGLTESPTSLTLWDSQLFWHSSNTIFRAPVTGDSVVIVRDQLFEIYDIAIAERRQQGSVNPCNQQPVAVCSDATLYVSQSCTVLGNAAQLATGSHDPDGDFLQYALSSPGPFAVGTHQLSVYVSDGYLQDTCSFTLTVLDTVSPEMTCRDTTLILDNMGIAFLNPVDLLHSFTDNCDSIPDSLVISQQEFDINDIGQHQVTLQAFDASGNKTSCQSTVTIQSPPVNQPPVAVCDTLVLYVDDQCNTQMESLDLGMNSYDPDGDSITITHYPAGPYLPGDHLIETVVSDGLLADTCVALLIVIDTLAPVITCYDTGFVMDQSFLLYLSPDDLPVFFEDNCDAPDSIILSQSVFNCEDLGTDTIVVTFFFNGMQQATCLVPVYLTGPDSDNDGVADCSDECPDNPEKSIMGQCGCTTNEVDSDGDGTPDCEDECPNDPNKILQGQCGCSFPDTDSDGDGVSDCLDFCPNDPDKVFSGSCGCGVADADNDGDGILNCRDGCPDDPIKVTPGVNGCGVMDPTPPDADGDGTPDVSDQCPFDPDKTHPGICGCGTSDATPDSDGDGLVDCLDACPNDPLKISPGGCGCGVTDTDTDGDGAPDCIDLCPNDPDKVAPGVCGCGTTDQDSDADGILDCQDGCPSDSFKIAPGINGCGVVDPVPPDTDGDGTIDADDQCPLDPSKTSPGICGCGRVDSAVDTDGDGVRDCLDGCPENPLKSSADHTGCFSPCSDFNVMLDYTLMQNTTEISSTWINASGQLMADKIYLQAGNFLVFDPGFLINAGSDMAANIDACVGGISLASFQPAGEVETQNPAARSVPVCFWDELARARLYVQIPRRSRVDIEFVNLEKGTFGYLMYNEEIGAGHYELVLRNNAGLQSGFKVRVRIDQAVAGEYYLKFP